VDADKARGTGAVVRGGSTITPGLPGRIRRVGIASAVAAPIRVAGTLWGRAIVASSGLPYAFPLDTDEGVAGFAEFVADALANADAREQLAASRARIVEAGDAERRRLERNLHDGAQQRLVRLALCLREVEAKLDEEPAAARRYLASAREELALALQELRELAHGIHPAILSDRGLGPALDARTGGARPRGSAAHGAPRGDSPSRSKWPRTTSWRKP
jgi:signal transduction histidine kinase